MNFQKISSPAKFTSSWTSKGEDNASDRKASFCIDLDSSSSISLPFATKYPGAATRNLVRLQNKDRVSIFRPHFLVPTEDHHKELGEHVEDLWKRNEITDLIVTLREVDYPCHKTVLTCYSKYFRDHLLCAKSPVDVVKLMVPSITNEAFDVLLTYMYTSELNITCQNIAEVYAAAKKLGIDRAVTQCISIFSGQVKPDVNSVYLYVMAWKQKYADRARKALRAMTHKFEQIVGTPEFLDLDFPQVKTFISQDVQGTRSEVILFLAALKWLSYRYMEREEHATELMDCIRFPMMTLKELLACFSPPLLPGVLEKKAIRDKLLTALCYVASSTINEEKRFERYSCRPRKYLLPREEVVLWDPAVTANIQHKAATAIQSAWRSYKVRKSIAEESIHDFPWRGRKDPPGRDRHSDEPMSSAQARSRGRQTTPPKKVQSDQSVGSRTRRATPQQPPTTPERPPQRRSDPSRSAARSPTQPPKPKNIDLRVHQARKFLPKETDSDDCIDLRLFDFHKHDVRPKSKSVTPKSKPRRSFLENIRRSVVGLMGNAAAAAEEKQQTKDEKQKKVQDRFLPRIHPAKERSYGSSRMTSCDSLPDLSIRTDLKKYLCDSAQRSASQPETLHKIYTQATPEDHQDELSDLDELSSYVPPSGSGSDVYIVCTGGFRSDFWDGKGAGKDVFLFDPIKERWIRYGYMGKGRHHHCVVAMGSVIYTIGGCNPETTKDGRLVAEKECYKLDLNSRAWRKMADMHRCRMYHGVVAAKGKIFAVGGKDEEDRILGCIEFYSPDLDQWEFLATSRMTPRLGVGVCSHRDKIWIIGGMTQDDDGNIEVIKDVVCIDPDNEKWTQDPCSLPSPRVFASVTSFDGHLHVIGGAIPSEEEGEEQLTSTSDVMYFDEREKRWTFIASLPSSRHFVQTIVLGGNMYVMGGLTTLEKTSVDQVLCYTRSKRSWTSTTSVPVPLVGFAAAKVEASLLV